MHPVDPPFQQVMSVPPATWKTCLDAWEGYHSIPIVEEDRHITTFVTLCGRFWYKVLPQGFLTANNAYCKRYNKITRDLKNLIHCVDDALLWENTIEQNFFKTCQYLSLSAKHEITFNMKKFQFCQEEVEFLVFMISNLGICQMEDMLELISGVR